MDISEILAIDPIIAAVRNEDRLKAALMAPVRVIFLLHGNICALADTIKSIKDADKMVFVHLDLIDGLGRDQAAVQYMADYIKPDGIITTHNNLARYAKDSGLLIIQRIFLLDSMSLDRGIAGIGQTGPDAVEILPGTLPREIAYCHTRLLCPIIAGGLIRTKDDIIAALNAGAMAVSTSDETLWEA
ncbi:MAG: glycerol uptake operon antiterminator [Clostridiales bacterium]|jgi:glycerol uptake operon antiterminator|nr:glycerol uptake operon antiterminator [Clostridiales bacterium]MDK2992691.1 glycerol uptake operon antiterminator [Clostridiales bacterium]